MGDLTGAPLTAAAALEAAAGEGLWLAPGDSLSGYLHVECLYGRAGSNVSYRARPRIAGVHYDLGLYETSEEAALTAARFFRFEEVRAEMVEAGENPDAPPAPLVAAAAPPPAPEPAFALALAPEVEDGPETDDEDGPETEGEGEGEAEGEFAAAVVPHPPSAHPHWAYAAAAAEGLGLIPIGSPTGFKYVHSTPGGKFRAAPRKHDSPFNLGVFDAPEEAALAVARCLGRTRVRHELGKAARAARKAAVPDMTAEEARAAATAEGLTLVPGANATGFQRVAPSGFAKKRFRVEWRKRARQLRFRQKTYATPEEAALVYARYLGPAGIAAALAAQVPVVRAPPMTEAAARATAAAEGLALVPGDGETGFKHVTYSGSCRDPALARFLATVYRDRHPQRLGVYDSAAEAALAVARKLGPAWVEEELAARERASVPEPEAMSEAEAHATAAAEGLTLLTANSESGYLHVYRMFKSTWFRVQTRAPGVNGTGLGRACTTLGKYRSAAEAALAYARHLGPERIAAVLAPPPPPPPPPQPTMTAAEAHAAAEAEGLVLIRSSNATGYRHVIVDGRGCYRARLYPCQSASISKRAAQNASTGVYALPEEAALAVARAYGSAYAQKQKRAAELAAARTQSDTTAAGAVAAAAAPGMDILSGDSSEDEFVIEESAAPIPPPS